MIALQTDRQSELKSSFSTHNTVFVYIVLFLEEGKIAVITLNNPGIQYFFQYGLETNYFWLDSGAVYIHTCGALTQQSYPVPNIL